MENGRYLYLIKFNNVDFYKFGISNRPLTRLENISNEIGNKDVRLFIFAWFDNAIAIENILIKKYKQIPNPGKAREWKELSHNEVNYIKNIIYEHSEKRNEGFQFNPADQTMGKVKDIKRKEKSFYAANHDRFSGTTPINQIKSFRISEDNEKDLKEIAKYLERTEGWIINMGLSEYIDYIKSTPGFSKVVAAILKK